MTNEQALKECEEILNANALTMRGEFLESPSPPLALVFRGVNSVLPEVMQLLCESLKKNLGREIPIICLPRGVEIELLVDPDAKYRLSVKEVDDENAA